MKIEQEPKYDAKMQGDGEIRLENRRTMQAIPDDEPVFIFRARDIHAIDIIVEYARRIIEDDRGGHIRLVHERIEDFIRFAEAHPARMKVPDS